MTPQAVLLPVQSDGSDHAAVSGVVTVCQRHDWERDVLIVTCSCLFQLARILRISPWRLDPAREWTHAVLGGLRTERMDGPRFDALTQRLTLTQFTRAEALRGMVAGALPLANMA